MQDISSYGVTERGAASTDIELHVERIRRVGFTILDSGLHTEDVRQFSDRLDRLQAEQARRAGGIDRLVAIGEHETVRCCLAYDDAFVKLAANPRVLAVSRALMGDYVVLMQQNGIVNPAGRQHVQTAFHRDLPYQHFVSSRPLAVSALFCVDAFTAENGATVILPGTHKAEEFPSPALVAELAQGVEAPMGHYLVFDSMLFHRAGSNTSARPRRAVNHVYGLPFVAQQISLPDQLGGRHADDPDLRRLFGYESGPASSVDAWWQRRSQRRG